jgi:tetratricopeptide (TPR) repeat protein
VPDDAQGFATGAAILARVDREALPPAEAALLLNNLAWFEAHRGRCAKAVSLADEAVACAEAAQLSVLPYCLGTLGAARVLAGRPQSAVAVLERALALGEGDGYAQSIRAFYLGEALFALGRREQSAGAWGRAIAESPASSWAERARERLGALVLRAPYR